SIGSDSTARSPAGISGSRLRRHTRRAQLQWRLAGEPRAPCTDMKYAILTFGCRVNQADSMVIERDLRARGGVVVPAVEADVIVVNSCSVTATADQGTRQAIRRAAREN